MATTINAYNVTLGLAAGGFIDSAKLARNETASLHRTFQSLVTPAERIAKQLDTLEAAYKKGAIDADHYGEAVGRLNAKLSAIKAVKLPVIDATVVENTSRLGGALTKADAVAGSMATRLAGVAVAAASFHKVEQAVEGVVNRVRILDAGLKKAAAIDADFNQLQRFVYMADNIANIDSNSAVNMLTKLTKNIGDASLAGDKAGRHFKDLGLDIDRLVKMSAVEQFDAITDAIRRVENPSERAAYAVKFFGKQGVDLIPMLTASNEELDQASDRFQELTYHISELDAEQIAIAADAMADLGRATDSVQSKFATELAPVFTNFANDMTAQAMAVRDGTTDIRGLGFAYKIAADGIRDLLMQAQGIQVLLKFNETVSQFAAPFADKQAEALRSAMLDEKIKASQARIANPPPDTIKATAEAAEHPKADQYDAEIRRLEHLVNIQERGESIAEQIRLSEAGATDEQIERIVTLQQQLDLKQQIAKAAEETANKEAKARDAMERAAEGIRQKVADPIDKLADALMEIDNLKQAQLITDIEWSKARQEAFKQAVPDIKIEQPKSMEVGSAEAYKFITAMQNDNDTEAIKIAQKQLIEEQATRRAAELTNQKLDKLADVSPRRAR